MSRKLSLVMVLTACALAATFAQTLPTGVVKKASMGGITDCKHIDPNALSIVKAGDFKTAGAYVTRKSSQ